MSPMGKFLAGRGYLIYVRQNGSLKKIKRRAADDKAIVIVPMKGARKTKPRLVPSCQR